MDTHCLFNNDLTWFDYFSLIASLFAIFVSAGYWVKPRLKFCIFRSKNKWKVNLINYNWLRSSVKDIYCEIAISEYENFKFAKTLELIKNSTVFLRACHDNYIFITKKSITEIIYNDDIDDRIEPQEKTTNMKRDYKYIRVRILAPNFIGVKKSYEKKMRIIDVIENECDPCRKLLK